MRKQTFLQGAFILVIANIVVKIIGAGFKIPLYRLIGQEGMGYFNGAYQLYTFMFVVATAGFPIAVSKMVAESMARENRREADKVFYIAAFLLGIFGLIGAFLLYFYAKDFAVLLGNIKFAEGIMAIAPAVFLVSIMSAYRGYFQGRQNMYPTAFSEVIEAAGKLVIGYFLAVYLMKQSLHYASAGAVFGVTTGAFLAVVYLMITYFSVKRQESNHAAPCKRFRTLAKELVFIAVPITIGASVSSLTNLADLFTIISRLKSTGMAEGVATAIYGAYSGSAVTMFNMPLTVVVALAMSVVPAIAGALELGRKLNARVSTEIAIRMTILFSLPCAVGLSVLAKPVLAIAFDDITATTQLQKLAYAVIFVSLLSVTNAILQAYGHFSIPVINMTIGGIIKVLLNYLYIPVYGIEAAPVSTTICYFIIVVMNLFWVVKVSGLYLSFQDFILRPVAAVAGMAIFVIYTNQTMVSYGLNEKIAAIIAAAFGAVIYAILLFVVKAIKKQDIELLPKGPQLAKFLEKINFLRN